jgi:protein-S-isoprenylcysteine O-methyltransferase Ste14
MVQRGAIEREEKFLRQRFGETYREYAERVPRWL